MSCRWVCERKKREKDRGPMTSEPITHGTTPLIKQAWAPQRSKREKSLNIPISCLPRSLTHTYESSHPQAQALYPFISSQKTSLPLTKYEGEKILLVMPLNPATNTFSMWAGLSTYDMMPGLFIQLWGARGVPPHTTEWGMGSRMMLSSVASACLSGLVYRYLLNLWCHLPVTLQKCKSDTQNALRPEPRSIRKIGQWSSVPQHALGKRGDGERSGGRREAARRDPRVRAEASRGTCKTG